MLFVSFDALVTDYEGVRPTLERFTGLDLGAFDPEGEWPRIGDSYAAYGSSADDTQFYRGALEPARSGASRDLLSERHAGRIQHRCSPIAERLDELRHRSMDRLGTTRSP